MPILPYFVAASWLFEAARNATRADALLGRDEVEQRKAYDSAARYLSMAADDLGFVVMPKADHLALTSFIEELRDFHPTIFRDTNPDPQDCTDDVMPLGEFQAFQADAADLIGPKARVAA